MNPHMDVILPVYREANDIQHVLDQVVRFSRNRPDLRFFFVDDGSPDNTAQLIQAYLDEHAPPHIQLLAYTPNYGKGYAIQYAISHTTAPKVMFMDGDLAYSLDHIDLIHQQLEQAEVVIGSRWLAENRDGNRRGLLRRAMGESFNMLARVLCGLNYPDTQAGLKGFTREAADTIFPRLTVLRYAVDVEMLYLAHRFGYTVKEIPASVSKRHAEQPTSVNLVRDPVNMFGALLRIRLAAMRGRYA